MTRNVFLEFVQKYGPAAGPDGPVLFAREVFGSELDPWQEDVLRAYGRGEPRMTIRACHGPGKTYIAAVMIWHSLLCRFPQNTVATAPSRGQLEGALVKEVKVLHGKLPTALASLYEIKKLRVELIGAPEESYFEARTAREEKPEALQGVHCDDGYVLLIADEASGVHNKIFESASGSMSGERTQTLLLSNPTRTSGYFFDSHMKPGMSDTWYKVHVSADDSSRVTDDFKQQIADEHGEDSSVYRVRVLGEFPKVDLDTIIPLGDVEDAQHRDIVVPKGIAEVWGVDIARFGDDANALVKRSRLHVNPDIKVWDGIDLMQTAGRVKREWDETPVTERPSEILVDVIGLGAGVCDRLQELGLPVRGINVAETASASDKYRNLRTELWFKARDWLAVKNHRLPVCEGGCARECPHHQLKAELTTPRYSLTSSGKYFAEPKSEMKKRGFKSPNVADAFVLTFASEPAALIHGSSGDGWGFNWNQPISRDLAHV